MASHNSAEGSPSAAKWAVFVDGVDRVLAATGLESAVAAHEMAERSAVKQDELDQQPTHGFPFQCRL